MRVVSWAVVVACLTIGFGAGAWWAGGRKSPSVSAVPAVAVATQTQSTGPGLEARASPAPVPAPALQPGPAPGLSPGGSYDASQQPQRSAQAASSVDEVSAAMPGPAAGSSAEAQLAIQGALRSEPEAVGTSGFSADGGLAQVEAQRPQAP